MYPWENEPWYQAQAARWEKMKKAGWKFWQPPEASGDGEVRERKGTFIGIVMEGGPSGIDKYRVFIPKAGKTPEEIHAAILMRCEYHAGFQEPVPPRLLSFKNADMALYMRTFEKFFRVTAVCRSAEEANIYLERHTGEAVIDEDRNGLVYVAENNPERFP